MQKLLTFFSKNIRVYAIFDNPSFNDMLTNDILILSNWTQVVNLSDMHADQDSLSKQIYKRKTYLRTCAQ